VKQGDLVSLSNNGAAVHVRVAGLERRSWARCPTGTLAIVLESFIENRQDGPSMDSYAKVMVGDLVGFVWLYECKVIDEDR
jgi:hypothetical protein